MTERKKKNYLTKQREWPNLFEQMKINQLSLKQAHVISSNTFPVGKRYKIKLGRVNVQTGKRRFYFSTIKLYNSPTLEKDY